MKRMAQNERQWVLYGYFAFKDGDTIVNEDGVEKPALGNETFKILYLPVGAVIVDASMTVLTASNDGGTATLSLKLEGGSPGSLLAAQDLKTVAHIDKSSFTFDYKPLEKGQDVIATVADANGNGTAGSYRIDITYVIMGRANENQPN